MEFERGLFVPDIDSKKCTDCGQCLQVCPGVSPGYPGISDAIFSEEALVGKCYSIYAAHSLDDAVRLQATSGGLIPALVVALLTDGDYDSAFLLDFPLFEGKPARIRQIKSAPDVLAASKSKYIPASVYEIVRELKKKNAEKHIIVGTPCQFAAIKKTLRHYDIDGANLLFLGLFCDKTLNYNIYEYFEDKFGRPIEKLDFRNKEDIGWPGNMKAVFKDGKSVFADKSVRTDAKPYFQLNRCLFCLDKLNLSADIAFGDCYVKNREDKKGKSTIIIRSARGKAVLEKYRDRFSLEESSEVELIRSQQLLQKRENYENARGTSARLLGAQSKLRLGAERKYGKINRRIVINKIIQFVQKWAERLFFGIVVGSVVLKHSTTKAKPKKFAKDSEGNVVIVGGELSNKGAQAMTFAVVDRMSRLCPRKRIYLFSDSDYVLPEKQKAKYRFSIMPWSSRIKMSLLSPSCKSLLNDSISESKFEGINKIMRKADILIDISGYALSSEWGFKSSLKYLMNISVAREWGIPFYIFPQSLGPFDYGFVPKVILYPLMKMYLNYCQRICAREADGVKWVSRFSPKNVERQLDIVLKSGSIDPKKVYWTSSSTGLPELGPNSVGIIPNQRVMERADPDKLFGIYVEIIKQLRAAGKKVYLLTHAAEDHGLCSIVAGHFEHDPDVIFISAELNAIETEDVIKQFDFILASRYHSIVHAFKNGIPAIVIGWAVKYSELMRHFEQMDYVFDYTDLENEAKIGNAVSRMMVNHHAERNKIRGKMKHISTENDIYSELDNIAGA